MDTDEEEGMGFWGFWIWDWGNKEGILGIWDLRLREEGGGGMREGGVGGFWGFDLVDCQRGGGGVGFAQGTHEAIEIIPEPSHGIFAGGGWCGGEWGDRVVVGESYGDAGGVAWGD
jgi:hypothetical protein